MKRIKARTFKEFFESHMGRVAWKRGRDMFQATGGNEVFDDGQYNVRLTGAVFSIDDMPKVIFTFEFQGHYKGMTINKVVQVNTAHGILQLLKDYRAMGLAPEIYDPNTIMSLNLQLERDKPFVSIILDTNREGLQLIQIDPQRRTREDIPVPPAATTTVEPPKRAQGRTKKAPAASEALPELIPPQIEAEAVLPEIPEEERAPVIPADPPPPLPPDPEEVDLKPGMKIRFKRPGETSTATGTIKSILEEEQEVIVLDDDGQKRLVAASDIRGVVATPVS